MYGSNTFNYSKQIIAKNRGIRRGLDKNTLQYLKIDQLPKKSKGGNNDPKNFEKPKKVHKYLEYLWPS
jgi:hypothetical protein